MNTKIFSSYLLLPLALMLLANCKKHHNDNPEPTPEIPPIVEETKRYLPIKFESGNKVMTLKYLDNTALLSEIESTDGRKEIYTYNSEQKPVKYERYQAGEQVYLIDYLRNADGLVVKSNRFIIAPRVFTPEGYNTFTYNSDNKLISYKTYDNANKLLQEEVSEYSPTGDLITTIKITTGQANVTTNLSYDNKNGVFKEVSYTKLLAINATEDFLISAPHNLMDRSYSSSGSVTYSYQYNTDNYPVQYIVTDGTNAKTVKVNYRQH